MNMYKLYKFFDYLILHNYYVMYKYMSVVAIHYETMYMYEKNTIQRTCNLPFL